MLSINNNDNKKKYEFELQGTEYNCIYYRSGIFIEEKKDNTINIEDIVLYMAKTDIDTIRIQTYNKINEELEKNMFMKIYN